ncbi:MAG TPA: hypothetical protein PK559_06365 [Ignavibacteriaceae bacterium]|nr:hypothetical protein [Ignavibacteriaceae bacterium]
MKKFNILFSIVIFTSLFLVSCGDKNEPLNFEAFSMEVFAYDLGDGYEINASVRVKGFVQTEESGNHSTKVSFVVDLVKPDGTKISNIANGIQEKNQTEKFIDIPVEAQFELDTTYAAGNYKLILNLKDEVGKQTVVIEKDFSIDGED